MDYSHNATFIIVIAVLGTMFGILFTAVAFALFKRPSPPETDEQDTDAPSGS